jgi:hypothetical protein
MIIKELEGTKASGARLRPLYLATNSRAFYERNKRKKKKAAV